MKTVAIPDRIHGELVAHSTDTGIKLRAIVERALLKYLATITLPIVKKKRGAA